MVVSQWAVLVHLQQQDQVGLPGIMFLWNTSINLAHRIIRFLAAAQIVLLLQLLLTRTMLAQFHSMLMEPTEYPEEVEVHGRAAHQSKDLDIHQQERCLYLWHCSCYF
jgi:hypothetical protein